MPEFSPVSFSEVWETTLKNHADDTFLIFENRITFEILLFP